MLDAYTSSYTTNTLTAISGEGLSLPNGTSSTTFSNTTGATFEIQFVQLEKNTTASP